MRGMVGSAAQAVHLCRGDLQMTEERSPVSPRNASVLIVGVGSGRGLGAAIARRFANGGYAVALVGPKRKTSCGKPRRRLRMAAPTWPTPSVMHHAPKTLRDWFRKPRLLLRWRWPSRTPARTIPRPFSTRHRREHTLSACLANSATMLARRQRNVRADDNSPRVCRRSGCPAADCAQLARWHLEYFDCRARYTRRYHFI